MEEIYVKKCKIFVFLGHNVLIDMSGALSSKEDER